MGIPAAKIWTLASRDDFIKIGNSSEKKKLRKMLILATIEFKVKQTLGFSSSQQESWFYQHLI